MFYKNWPYWLRGVVISVLVMLILQIIGFVLFFNAGKCDNFGCFSLWAVAILPATISAIPFIPVMSLIKEYLSGYEQVVFFYLIYPTIGALIGLIYGKIKSKIRK